MSDLHLAVLKDSIFAVILASLFWLSNYPQRYFMLVHAGTFALSFLYRNSTETDLWRPSLSLLLCACIVLTDLWVATSLLCNALAGVRCCAPGEDSPPFGLGVPLCAAHLESLWGIVPALYITNLLLAVGNLLGVARTVSSQRPQASLVASLEFSYIAIKLWVLLWSGVAYGWLFVLLEAATVLVSLSALAASFWWRDAASSLFASAGLVDILTLSGVIGHFDALSAVRAVFLGAHALGLLILVASILASTSRPETYRVPFARVVAEPSELAATDVHAAATSGVRRRVQAKSDDPVVAL